MIKSKIINKIIDCGWKYLQIILLFVSFFIPKLIKLSNRIKDLNLVNSEVATDLQITNMILLTLIKKGDMYLGFGLVILLYFFLIKKNSNEIINNGNRYHNHPYFYYWICSHLLGYKKCSLILVPIYMQIKLVINDTFKEFDYGPDELYINNNDISFSVTKINFEYLDSAVQVNIVISDTYNIKEISLPHTYLSNPTIKIDRDYYVDANSRIYSPKLIQIISNEILSIPGKQINLFATTNAKNTYYITKIIFKKANRNSIEELNVFQAEKKNENDWIFNEKAHKI